MLLANKFCLKHLRSRTFILDLWYWQHCYFIAEVTDIIYRLLSKHLFQRTQEHDGCTKPLGNDTFV